jgi:hypothetical protein
MIPWVKFRYKVEDAMIDTITLLLAITHIQREALELAEGKIKVYADMLAVADSRIRDMEAAIVELEAILDEVFDGIV